MIGAVRNISSIEETKEISKTDTLHPLRHEGDAETWKEVVERKMNTDP